MMEDENFRKENESVLSVAGVRIPTQGPNALMGATIKKFLPKYAGPVVILPAEIVAQAGSDYDIDKIYTMFKSMAYINGKVHEVSKSDSKKSKDELKKKWILCGMRLNNLKRILINCTMTDRNIILFKKKFVICLLLFTLLKMVLLNH